jgi:probable rRNA maturation factor
MNHPVKCFFEDTGKLRLGLVPLNAWVQRVMDEEGGVLKSLSIIICSDRFLHTLNKQFLKHDTLTDIITFPYHEEGAPIEAELYISIDRVRENAGTMGTTWREELDRVIIHGVLHLLGYEDATPVQKEEIHRKEDYCLTLRP